MRVVMLMSVPARHCIRHGAQPGRTWLDDREPAAQALVAGDQCPRGVYLLLRIHLGLLHFQFQISDVSAVLVDVLLVLEEPVIDFRTLGCLSIDWPGMPPP